ncbi:MAG: hypothetical protein ACOCSG_06030 [Guyparkeria sp.]
MFNQDSMEQQIPYYLTRPRAEGLLAELEKFRRSEPIDYFIDGCPEEMLQGDCWSGLKVVDIRSDRSQCIKGVVLSNSCDVDPGNRRDFPAKIVFAPIVSLDSYIDRLERAGVPSSSLEGKLASIRRQRITNLFYLPSGGPLSGEHIVLLDDVHCVPLDYFWAGESGSKVFTLSQVGFYLFVFKLSIHFCRFHEEVQR